MIVTADKLYERASDLYDVVILGEREIAYLTNATAEDCARRISRIVASEHTDGTVYVTQQGRSDDDFAPYVWKSTDAGRTFTSIASNLPAGAVNVIREDPKDPNTLYVGTEFGAFISKDGGQKWDVLGGHLPSAQVSDMQIQKRDDVLVISTYGRGMWAIDLTKTR